MVWSQNIKINDEKYDIYQSTISLRSSKIYTKSSTFFITFTNVYIGSIVKNNIDVNENKRFKDKIFIRNQYIKFKKRRVTKVQKS